MNVKVYRFHPGQDQEAHYDEFQINIQPEERKTVMDLLDYIGDEIDPGLSFYSHSACRQGICGRCAVKVNGKVVLACNTVLTGQDVVLEPATSRIVKDLVIYN